MSVTLRPATAADAEAVSRLAIASFVAAFGDLYRPADMQAFLDEYRQPEHFREAAADPAQCLQIAEIDGAPVAYALVAFDAGFDERPDPQPRRPAMLSQLYCAPDMSGRGLGAALIEWAIAAARADGADALQLSVYAENFGAQRFYRRHGFRHMADIDFWVGDHRDDEFLYELAL